MFDSPFHARLGLGSILDKVVSGHRLDAADGERLFACPDVLAVGRLAHLARTARLGLKAHYVRNRQINYSNICDMGCRFCAFARREGQDGAFSFSRDEILARAVDDGGQPYAEIHVVGGCSPHLPLSWFEETFRALKSLRPNAVLKGLTVTEVNHLAARENIPSAEVFARLKAAGVSMITGGGAEIFAPQIRQRICPAKISGEDYLRLSGEAHAAGLASNCTMLFGHVESHADRVDHLCKLRAQQDVSGGYKCFIPLAYQHANNDLADEVRSITGKPPSGPQSALDRLRTIAVSRLLLDNIPHIKAYWVMLGVKLAQTALYFGADDLDGTIEEERIGRMAGAASGAMRQAELEHMIRASGFEPVNRDALFRAVPVGQSASASPAVTGTAPDAQNAGSPCAVSFVRKDAMDQALEKAVLGGRLTRDQALALYRAAPLYDLGLAARAVRERIHPDQVVTYVADRNINYTDICVCGCRFCAFYRSREDGYLLDRATLGRKIEETLALGGTQILLQGGHHPDLPLGYYENLLTWIRDTYPAIHIHAFSPPEIVHFAAISGLPLRDVIRRLRDAGLASIPGGGAEVLADRVRGLTSPNKCGTAEWLGVMREAHGLGLKTTATMMFGHLETVEERLDHLFALRDLQDQTGGFTAFIPWTFQAANTALSDLPAVPAPGYLRLLAVSRLVLDNVPNIQASWVTMGPEIAQLALSFGANDFGSLMIEENVVAAAGVRFRLDRETIHDIIRAAGFRPVQRTMDYRPLPAHV